MAEAVSRAQLQRAIMALKAAGTPAKGVLCFPDGRAAVLTEAPSVALPDPANGDWVELAGDEAETPRAA